MPTQTYKRFTQAVRHLQSRGYSPGRLMRLARKYGYRAFANLAPSSRRRGDGSGGSGGGYTPRQPGSPAWASLPSGGSAGSKAAGGAALLGGVAAGSPAMVGAGLTRVLPAPLNPTKGQGGDQSPIDERKLGRELDIRPPSAKDAPRAGRVEAGTIDELVTVYVDELDLNKAIEKLLRIVGHYARSEGGARELWREIQTAVYETVNLDGRILGMWLHLTGLIRLAEDATTSHAGDVRNGLKAPIERALEAASGALSGDPKLIHEVHGDLQSWAGYAEQRLHGLCLDTDERAADRCDTSAADCPATKRELVKALINGLCWNTGNFGKWLAWAGADCAAESTDRDTNVFGPSDRPGLACAPGGLWKALATSGDLQDLGNKIAESVGRLTRLMHQKGIQ